MNSIDAIPTFFLNKNKNKKNDTRNKKVFDKFIKETKDFNDDIFSVIKSFMIEPIYKKSFRFIENREIRLVECKIDKSTFFIGKRYNNLIQVKQLRYHDEDVINPQFKMFKIAVGGQINQDGTKVLYEYVSVFGSCMMDTETINLEYGMIWKEDIYKMYYVVCADMYDNKLWDNIDQLNLLQLIFNNTDIDIDDETDNEMTDEEILEQYHGDIQEMMY